MSVPQSVSNRAVVAGLKPTDGLVFVSPGDFDLQFHLVAAAAYTPTDEEQAFIDCVNGCVDALSDFKLVDRNKGESDLLHEAQEGRNNGIKRLRIQAEAVVTAPPGLARNAEIRTRMAECWRIEGRFIEFLRHLNTTPFIVEPVVRADQRMIVEDLRIRVRDAPISNMRGNLKAEVDKP